MRENQREGRNKTHEKSYRRRKNKSSYKIKRPMKEEEDIETWATGGGGQKKE